jgi:hypothetical protein
MKFAVGGTHRKEAQTKTLGNLKLKVVKIGPRGLQGLVRNLVRVVVSSNPFEISFREVPIFDM